MSCSNRARLNRPSPLELERPRLSRHSVLPATVYCPDDDEPSSPTTPTHFSGLFGNGFASSSSSYCSREISPPITPSTEVYHGRRVKRKVSRANMRANNSVGSPSLNQARLSKYAAQAPCSTPDTPLSLFDNFCADVRAAAPVAGISDFQAAPPQPEFPRPSTAPELFQNPDERPASPRSSIVLGIGMKYLQPSSSHPSHQRTLSRKCTFPILGDWDVSDDDYDTPPFELVLKPWMPLQVVRKTSAPAILSTATEDDSPKLYSAADPAVYSDEISSTSRLYSATDPAHYSNGSPRPSRLYSATDPCLYSNDNSSTPSLSSESAPSISEVITGGEAQVMLLTQPIYRQSIVDVAGPTRRAPFGLSDHQPTYSQSVVDITSSASTPRHAPFAFGDHLRIDIPERSPSAPIVASESAVPFDTSESFPVEFSELPIDEAEIFNLVMPDVLAGFEEQPNDPEYPFPRESQECTIHPAWNELSKAERNSAFTTLRKKELERLANIMIPESPTAMSFRSGSFRSGSANSSALPSPSTAFDSLAIPSPASFRPNSRWSDYSVDEDAKESWRTSVFTHLHLPNVGIDLKKAVAAAKGGIINRRRKVVVEALVEEESASIRGTPSPRHSTATDTDSIVDAAIIASLPASNNRISASSGSSFKLSRIASPSIKPGKESKSTRKLTTSSDEDGEDDEASKNKGPGIKGVFGRYVVPHAKSKQSKDEKRREELKRKIRVVGGGKGGDWI